jgi:hypothetical protein
MNGFGTLDGGFGVMVGIKRSFEGGDVLFTMERSWSRDALELLS